MSSESFQLSDLESSEVDVAAVQSAITAMDEGKYGTCLVCSADLTEAVKADPLRLTCESHLALA
jgi:RNA polymerase-binding transcription factor DksA